ncbi:5-hydroxytryptamine receptor 3A-like [Syngnathoides biaculeatus]|uniref:5-hydroxytryptamine receptor 3A-like n=1 Tax=Syngnathoides biaculeatus TaxID=300417 RepID=UPI002ADD9688|nr:5-hydroxytryptamine receptor 3A-like [Syngnathoides biaculeatus]
MPPTGSFFFFFFFFVLHFTGVVSPQRLCSYHEVLDHLNMSTRSSLYSMTRPVKDYRKPTVVLLEVILYAILDVREMDQTFVPYVWIFTSWGNDHISWDPEEFCGIKSISLPTELLWKPDLTIEEMIEKDKAPPSPHLTIFSDGNVHVQNDQVLLSTCKMNIYQFPFDRQSCNLTFKSVIHSVQELQLLHSLSSAEATKWSREVMRTQNEWLFLGMTVANRTVSVFGIRQNMIVYTISMKRRPVLYIINFLLPVLFFLALDLASFFISDSGGEKLSFKVTVLLAVTVMQLILNEILPCSSNKIPLIAIYCIGIFALMLLSLLETIFAMYLMEKDAGDPSSRQGGDGEADCVAEKTRSRCCVRPCDASADENPPEDGRLTESSPVEKLSDETRDLMRALVLLLDSRKEKEAKPGYWTGLTLKINRIFYVIYIIAVSLFLAVMCFIWQRNHQD